MNGIQSSGDITGRLARRQKQLCARQCEKKHDFHSLFILLSASKQRVVHNDPNNSSPIASKYTVNSIQHQANCHQSIDC